MTVNCLWSLNMELWGIEMIHVDCGPIIIEDRRWQPLSDNVWIPVFPCSRTFFAELSFLMIMIMVTKAMFIFSRINIWWLHVWCLDWWILSYPSPRYISCPTSTWNHLSNIVTELFSRTFLYHATFFENCRFSLPFLEVVLLGHYFFQMIKLFQVFFNSMSLTWAQTELTFQSKNIPVECWGIPGGDVQSICY